jgi:hypothetical protein
MLACFCRVAVMYSYAELQPYRTMHCCSIAKVILLDLHYSKLSNVPVPPPPGTLQELHVAGTRMQEDAACMLLAAATSTRELQLLDLRGCVLGTRGCAAMAQLLRWAPQPDTWPQASASV